MCFKSYSGAFVPVAITSPLPAPVSTVGKLRLVVVAVQGAPATMQLLKLVVLNVSIKTHTAHGIRIVLVRNWAVLTQAGVPRRDYAFLYDTSVVRSGAIIVCMVSGKAPATDLPQGAVIFIMVRRVFIALEAIWERGGRPRLLVLLTREEANVSLQYCLTFKTVAAIVINPL
jgi:hypothetical protein